MESETMLKEILNALKIHAEATDKKLERMEQNFDKKLELMEQKFEKKFDALNEKMEKGFDKVNEKLDRLDKKVSGQRVELTETQETVDFVLSKVVQHEKKIRELYELHQ